MAGKGLVIFVEGLDEVRFFRNIIVPFLETRYSFVDIYQYQNQKKKSVNNYLKSIKILGYDYIYVTDMDFHPCATAKKEKIVNKYREVDINTVIVVKMEIESWYLAGLDKSNSGKLRISYHKNTDNLIKEAFDNLIPEKFGRKDFMVEVLKKFDFNQAKKQNSSFKYFAEKYRITLE